jgi:hypothetical protein
MVIPNGNATILFTIPTRDHASLRAPISQVSEAERHASPHPCRHSIAGQGSTMA